MTRGAAGQTPDTVAAARPDAGSPGCRVALLPDWRGPPPGGWQARWAGGRHGCELVEQDDWQWPRRGDWMARLDEWLLDGTNGAPVVLAAQGLGCHLAAAWADHSRHGRRVRGALLVSPPDLEREGLPAPLQRWAPGVRRPLPFPAVLLHGLDDPACAPQASRRLAADWGAQAVGVAGSAEPRPDDWPDAAAWWEGLCARPGR